MRTVLLGIWTCSRNGLTGRTASVIVRAASVSAHSAKPSSCSILLLANRLRPTQPSGLLVGCTRAVHTTSRWRAQSLASTERAPLSGSKVRASSKGDTAGQSSTLTQAELNDIFGQEIDRKGAAGLLSQLQRQRREGRLDERLPYPGQLIDRGLEYLRATYPVDEDAAIIARVDREMDGDWSLPQTNPTRSRSGQSGLMEIRRINKADREAEEAAEAAAKDEASPKRHQRSGALSVQKRSKKGALVTSNGPSNGHSLAIPESHQRRAEQIAAWMQASSKRVAELRRAATMKYIPQMSRWQRLWPSGVFTVSAVGLALIFAHVYIPPSQKARLFPDIPPALAAVGTIVTINVLVYLFWRFPYAWKSMNRLFMVVPAMPQAFSMLGAPFSHQEFVHLCGNLLGIAFLGTQCTFSITPSIIVLYTDGLSARRYRPRPFFGPHCLWLCYTILLRTGPHSDEEDFYYSHTWR